MGQIVRQYVKFTVVHYKRRIFVTKYSFLNRLMGPLKAALEEAASAGLCLF